MTGRYADAKQFKRHQPQLRIRLGQIMRDIRRKIESPPALEEAFALSLGRASQIHSQQRRQHQLPRSWRPFVHDVQTHGVSSSPARSGVFGTIKRTATPLRHRTHHWAHEDRRSPRPLPPYAAVWVSLVSRVYGRVS